MKIQKSILKSIIKECILEIFAETVSINEQKTVKTTNAERNIVRQNPIVENKSNVKTITNDPIMQEILAHTAATTLQEQVAAEKPELSRISVNNNVTVDDIPVAETQQNMIWNTLAFAQPKARS